MAMQQKRAVIGVFTDSAKAQRAVRELRDAGFTDDQIGVVGRDSQGTTTGKDGDADDADSYAAEGAATGVAAGAGLGALWGLGILAGVMPIIGPAIAGGALAAVLTSAAAGAAAAGLAGALVGMGIPKEDAEYYESEFKAGRTIVTVTAPGREHEVNAIFQRYGAYDRSTAPMSGTTTGEACHVGTTHQTAAQSSSQRLGATSGTHSASALHSGTTSSNLASGQKTVQAVEEELQVRKQPSSKAGEVNVRKEVHTEHKTIDVPVTREEVVVERTTPTSRKAATGDFKNEEIRVPIHEEEIRVEKVPVVKEEVSVRKRQVQGTEQVSADLRKEEIKIDKEGDARVRDERNKR